MDILTFPDPEHLADAASAFICDLALSKSNSFSIVLSGGSTPLKTYQRLVADSTRRKLDWSKVRIYWGDERCVPPDHSESNYRMAREALFDHISLPETNIHRMACEQDPHEGADEYERILRNHFHSQVFPQFDLVLLGLGDDGHTASLFPGTEILKERERWVAPVYVPHLDSWRISLTLPVINAASNVIFLVSGENKAPIMKEILQPATVQSTLPAGRVSPLGQLRWFVDQAASSMLE